MDTEWARSWRFSVLRNGFAKKNRSPLVPFPEHPKSGWGRRSAPCYLSPQPTSGTVKKPLGWVGCRHRASRPPSSPPRVPSIKLVPFPLSQRTPAAEVALAAGDGAGPADAAVQNPVPLVSLFGVFKERKLKLQRTKSSFVCFSFSP